jgi:hypothetical protein
MTGYGENARPEMGKGRGFCRADAFVRSFLTLIFAAAGTRWSSAIRIRICLQAYRQCSSALKGRGFSRAATLGSTVEERRFSAA